jgi:hypothetical protein
VVTFSVVDATESCAGFVMGLGLRVEGWIAS